MELIALLGLLILTALAIFQASLIAGAPLGEYAWGGQHKKLPINYRIGSVISIALYGVFAVFLATKAHLIETGLTESFTMVGMWIFITYFFLGIIMNALSRSKKERSVMVPVSAALAIIFLVVTIV